MTTISDRKKHTGTALAAGILAAAVFTSVALTGCEQSKSSKNTDPAATARQETTAASTVQGTGENKPADTRETQSKIMEDFKALSANNAAPVDAAKFIEKNISQVSGNDAAQIVDGFEKLQTAYLPKLEEKFNREQIQKELAKVYKPGMDISKADGISDSGLKTLLKEASDGGYKLETAEGMYFPIINYEYYKKFAAYVPADIKEYIEIKAIESNKVPAKDAALVISWDEALRRALRQEKFIGAYSSSIKINDIRELYKKYSTFILLGLNNTPLFSYDTKMMDTEAKKAYTAALGNIGDSSLLKAVDGLMTILKKSGYKLTDEADKYRKSMLESIK